MGMGAKPEGSEEISDLWDLDYGLQLNDKFRVKPIPTKKGCKYYFYDTKRNLSSQLEGKYPLELKETYRF